MASRDRSRLLRLGWNAARYALGPLAGVAIPWVVIHHASRTVWGEVVGVMVMVQLAAHVMNWGSRDLLLRAFAKRPMEVPAIWSASLASRMLLALPVALVLLFTFSLLFQDLTMALTWTLLLFITGSFDALVIQRGRFYASFLIDAIALVVQVLGIFLSAEPSMGSIIQWVLVGQTCRLLLLMLVFRSDISSAWRIDLRTHIVSAVPFFLIGLSGLLGSRMDLYTMSVLVDKETLGTYQVVAALFVQLQALAGLISTPYTRELYRMRHASVQRAADRLALLGLLLSPLFVLVAHFTFKYLFHFDLSWPVHLAGVLVAWPAFAYVPLITSLYRSGDERTVMWANFGAALTGLLAAIALVPALGITGGLLGAAAGQWLVLIIIRVRSHRPPHAMSTM